MVSWEKKSQYLLLMLLLLGTPFAIDGQTVSASCPATQLYPYEAEILIYLLPPAAIIRKEGWEVGWQLETDPKLNNKDFYNFWVYNAKRPSHGSVTIGYFSVNKHTGDVWDEENQEFVQSEEVSRVQALIRKGHCITATVIDEFQSRRPEIKTP